MIAYPRKAGKLALGDTLGHFCCLILQRRLKYHGQYGFVL